MLSIEQGKKKKNARWSKPRTLLMIDDEQSRPNGSRALAIERVKFIAFGEAHVTGE